MEEISVFCFTNLDNYKGKKWPDYFCCRPMIGEKVQCSTGECLKIVGITHTMIDDEVCLRIELWK
jgi:hypothetical protein